MKILILSCNTGEGHNSCAKALKIAMDRRGIACDIQDTLALVSDELSLRVANAYVSSTQGSLFETAYKIGGFVSDKIDFHQSIIYGVNRLYANTLYEYIRDNAYDAVVCVHLFPAEAMTALRRNEMLRIPTYFVMTDYTCIPFLPETDLDYYIIPHEHLIEEFVEKGVPREKIVPIGIPVDEQKFTTRVPQRQARQQLTENMGIKNWNTNRGHWYLIMSGSMGYGNVDALVHQLLARIREDDKVVCVCGRNQQMYDNIATTFSNEERLCLLGYTDQVSLLMDASDVIFTKPGGITSTEAMVKNIPIIHTAPIPGLENYNARFFHNHGLSYHTNDTNQQVAIAMRLCEDKAFKKSMLQQQRIYGNPRTSDDVIDWILNHQDIAYEGKETTHIV